MALDVYVGSLPRYYSGKWQPLVSQMTGRPDPDCGAAHSSLSILPESAPEFSNEFCISSRTRDGFSVSRLPDSLREAGGYLQCVESKLRRHSLPASEAQRLVVQWKSDLEANLPGRIDWSPRWVEDLEGAYFTDKLGFEPYEALLLWAAYKLHPELRRLGATPENLSDDPAYAASLWGESGSARYDSLLRCDYWVPGHFAIAFEAHDPLGDNARVGSTRSLLEALLALNTDTWKASQESLLDWLRTAPPRGASLEEGARFAMAVLTSLTIKAVESELPVLLDC